MCPQKGEIWWSNTFLVQYSLEVEVQIFFLWNVYMKRNLFVPDMKPMSIIIISARNISPRVHISFSCEMKDFDALSLQVLKFWIAISIGAWFHWLKHYNGWRLKQIYELLLILGHLYQKNPKPIKWHFSSVSISRQHMLKNQIQYLHNYGIFN